MKKICLILLVSVSLCNLPVNAKSGSEPQNTSDKTIQEAPLVSIPSHDAFFDKVSALCGQAFKGEIVTNVPAGDSFPSEGLVMHVRKCTDTQIQIPFHVGDDASRTWIITKTGAGLLLKHDHRYEDGSYHKSTMYGGHTQDAGFNELQSFPADQYSRELFVKSGIPQSMDNTWQIFIDSEKFSYRLIRPARDFRVDFDMNNPIEPPNAPWGYQD